MFYERDIVPNIRMGDILEGLISLFTHLKNPVLNTDKNDLSFNVTQGKYYAILTPCCSIGKDSSLGTDVITVTPLIQLLSYFLKSPHIREDFTRINRVMSAEHSLPPEGWNRLPPQEKQKRIDEGDKYAFLNYFVYEPDNLFSEYQLSNGEEILNTRYYMIDFKNLSVLKKSPISSFQEAKRLQLSITSRNELRDKLAYFFGNIPREDCIIEAY